MKAMIYIIIINQMIRRLRIICMPDWEDMASDVV